MCQWKRFCRPKYWCV